MLEMNEAYKIALVSLIVLSFRHILNAIRCIYATFLRPSKNLKAYGEWAVVTGATDGIGKAYAMELARKGLKIVLISRSQDKLDATKKEIESASDVEVMTIAQDLGQGREAFDTIRAQLAKLDVGVLVNNVGISYDYPDYFLDLPQDRRDKLIQLNIVATNEMTDIVLPSMTERKRGAIINISSGSGTFPVPLLTVYSATKAYVDFFSQGLAHEYRSKNVFVQSVTPLFVASKLSKMRPSFFVPSPKSYARHAVSTIGYDTVTSGFWLHEFQLWLAGIMYKPLRDSQLFKMHLGLRKRALKKKADKAKKQ